MRRWLLLLLCLVAAVAGAVAGHLGPPSRRVETGRPSSVESALRALDQFERDGNRAALAAALRTVEPARSLGSPWQDERDLVETVASSDDDALWSFATTSPKGAAPARALRLLAALAKDVAIRSRAAQRFSADYPSSWAVGRIGRLR